MRSNVCCFDGLYRLTQQYIVLGVAMPRTVQCINFLAVVLNDINTRTKKIILAVVAALYISMSVFWPVPSNL